MKRHSKKTMPIAVIGAAIRLPQADRLSAFWDHLVHARDLISEVPAERWEWQKHYDSQRNANTTQSKWGGFLEGVEQFDASFFRISNREARLMDPQQRLLLELTWELFEDAGYKASALSGSRTGVFIGACHNDYSELIDQNLTEIDAYITTGTCPSILANRLSYFYNLHGPSLTINTACSSSLVAVHQALQSLQNDESDWAIAGGVNLCLTPKLYIASSRAGMLAKDGRCKAFAEGADGYVRGEGAGVVLLKALEKAVQQGDHVYAVIRGSAANHGGTVNSITVPNPHAQAELIAEALRQARVRPERVTYIETHGTGTALGDPIEVFGLKQAFQKASSRSNSRSSRKAYCGLGSVKTNIGHLEPAAGIAGLIKVLLSLQHRKIPATLHLEKVNRLIDLKDSPFYFVTETKEWEPLSDSRQRPLARIAGVSSFGFGGANAHVVLEEFQKNGKRTAKKTEPELIVLSAHSKEQLQTATRRLADFCALYAAPANRPEDEGTELRDAAFTLQAGREEMEERLAVVADDFRDLHRKLTDFSSGVADARSVFQGRIQDESVCAKSVCAKSVCAESGRAESGRAESGRAKSGRAKSREKEINEAIRKRDLARIARHWISGRVIPWGAFYARRPAKRISLPAYPFEHKPFWMSLKPSEAGSPVRTTGMGSQSPVERSAQGKIALKVPGSGMKREAAAAASGENPVADLEKSRPVARPAAAPPEPPVSKSIAAHAKHEIRKVIKEKAAQTLYADPAELDENKPFAEIGLDSILAVELVKSLNQVFGIDLKASKLYDHASIALLTEYLAGIIRQPMQAAEPPPHERAGELRYPKEEVVENEEVRTSHAGGGKAGTAHPGATGGLDPAHAIAIIGMAGRFPGADDLEAFWQNLVQGRDCVSEIPPERWDIKRHYSPDANCKEKSYGKWGGFLQGIDRFDPLFFNISPAEAKIMDPHQRLVLEEAWKALEDAGYSASALNRIRCGLFVGAMSGEEYYPHIYNLRSILAARLAYFLNLKGPAVTLDTACSSALVAVHLACQSLLAAETEMMIAGGISLYLTEKLFVQMSQVKMLSPQGKNRPFDDRADGIVPAEGVGMVVLKRLDKALADRDRVHAIIRGSGINQDGRTNSITAPSLEAQKQLEIAVYRRANVHPETIRYVEAHGTGTKLGDPIEIDALSEAFAEFTNKKQYCGIGSVKSNLGHPSAAAGVASLLKVVLAMQHGRIPATIHYQMENRHIHFEQTPFYVVSELEDWKSEPNVPRRAAISTFGISGTNAHLVLEEFRPERSQGVHPPLPRQLMVFSAKTRERLQEAVKRFRAFLDQPGLFSDPGSNPEAGLARMAYTLQTGREAMHERIAVLVSDQEECKSVLDRYLEREKDPDHLFSADSGPEPFGSEAPPAKDDRRQIMALIFQKQLQKLARLWVQGYDIDWALLYGRGIPVKTSLPGYPLERRRYWKEEPYEPAGQMKPSAETGPATGRKTEAEKDAPGQNRPAAVRAARRGIDREAIASRIKRELADILSVEQKELDEQTPLQEFGLDSIFAVELVERLNKALGLRIKASELYNYPTISRFTGYLETFLQEDPLPEASAPQAEEFCKGAATTEPSKPDTVKRLVLKQPAGRAEKAVAEERAVGLQPVAEKMCGPQANHRCGSTDIAVVGMAGRFPGAENIQTFWEHLERGVDSVGAVPANRWGALLSDEERRRIKGGFLQGIDRFDPLFFRISPMEAEVMDPQQRLFLEEAWKAFEDAGYAAETLAGKKCGVFVGVAHSDYLQHMEINAQNVNAFHLLGTSNSILGARLSYLLNLTGPNLAVDTACSSSLVAVYEACRSMADGESELALAGGVSVLTTPNLFIMGGKAGMLSRDGICRAFDREADGFVLGEGVGAVVLKPLAQALADRNHIYGVIKGWGVNQDGKTNGLTAPNGLSQLRLEKEVYEKFGIDPGGITYVEAHGTGTKLGDPIEINALIDAFGAHTARKTYCGLGSVKTNIGHSLAAAGIAGLIKVLLCFQHGRLVPSLHFKNANSQIRLAESPFYVSEKSEEWIPAAGRRRQAAISSFGFSGTNCHMVLEEGPDGARKSIAAPGLHLIVLSAKTEAALWQKAKDLEQWLTAEGRAADLGDIAYTLLAGRSHFPLRLAWVVAERAALRQILAMLSEEEMKKDLEQNRMLKEARLQAGSEPEALGRQGIAAGKDAGPPSGPASRERWEGLVKLYRAGVSLDWRTLFREEDHALISMPVYPFAREAYWVTNKRKGERQAQKSEGLLPEKRDDRFNLQKGATIVFEKVFLSQNKLLDQHRVHGSAVLPAVVYLEMAWEAIQRIDPDRRYALTDVHWLQPAAARDDRLALHFSVHPEGEGLHFEIFSKRDSEEVRHASGSFQPEREKNRESPPLIRVSEMKSTSQKEIAPDDLYRRLAEHQVHYGPYYQTLDRLWIGRQGVLGHWRLAPECIPELAEYRMHPAAMDGALHTIAGLQQAGEQKENPFLPFSLERIRFYQALPAAGYVHTRQTGRQTYDVLIGDEEGQVCFIWEGLVLRESRGFFDDFFFYPQWVLADARETESATETRQQGKEDTVSVYAEEGLALASLIREACADRPLHEIKIGSAFRRLSSGDYEVAPRDAENWLTCFRELSRVRVVYFLGGLVKNHFDGGDPRILEQCQEKGLFSLFRLLKALDAAGLGAEALCIKIVTNQSREVIPGEPLLPFSAGMRGLAHSIAKEYPRWTIQCLDVELDDQGRLREPEQSLALILQEAPGGRTMERALRRGHCYQPILQPLALPNATEIPFRQKGVYLILGGAGGLGLVLSRYLAEAFQARLVLVGRSRPDQAKEEAFAKIRAAGGEALYLTADACCFEDMRQAVERAEKYFGAIQGVVHSAIVLKDAVLSRMPEAILQDVLAPKTLAVLHLFNLFRNAALDFMLFFSSGQSFSCKAGQGAYAAASTFEDAYARYMGPRVAYPVRVINWGYWGSVGVVADEKHHQALQALGVQSIEPEQGLEAMRRILGHPLQQVMALKAGKEEQERIGIRIGERVEWNPHRAPSLLREFNGERERYTPRTEPEAWAEQALQALEKLAQHLLLDYFCTTGLLPAAGEKVSEEYLLKKGRIAAPHEALFRSLLKILVRSGYLQREQGMVSGKQGLSAAAMEETIGRIARERETLLRAFPALQPQVELLTACLKNYPDMLSGKTSPMQVLFPDGNKELLESVYRGQGINDYYAQEAGRMIRRYGEKRLQKEGPGKIRILELGAGTGGTSALVLPLLADLGEHLEYAYSDLSKGFVEHGKERFGAAFPFTRFRVLDLEKPPAGQGWGGEPFDLVLASNVIHATRHIGRTLGRIKTLLKRQGLLLVHEVTRVQSFDSLIFGLTPGWWLSEDRNIRMPDSPLLELATWKEMLAVGGFGKPWAVPFGSAEGGRFGHQSILLAESDGLIATDTAEETARERRQREPEADNMKSERLTHAGLRSGPEATQSATDQKDLQSRAIDYIKTVFSEVLKIKKEALEIDRTFEHYGVDSLVGLNLIAAFARDLGKLPSTLLFENLTIEQLGLYFMREHFKELRKVAPPAAEKAPFARQGQGPSARTPDARPKPPTSIAEESGGAADDFGELFHLTDADLKARLEHMPLEALQGLWDTLLKREIR